MQQVAGSTAAPPAVTGGASVWDQLADRLNLAYERPRLRDGIVARRFTTARGDPYYIVKNPDASAYVRLAADEYTLLDLMDGERQVKDLVLAYFCEHQTLAFERIAHLVAQLRQYRLLVEEPRNVWEDLAASFARRTWTYRFDHLLRSFQYREFGLGGLDAAITALYRRGGWLCFTPPAVLLGALLATTGWGLFVWELLHAARDPLRFGGSYTAGLLMLLALWWAAISLHELGHALATKHFGSDVPRGGFMLYYGMPAFFTDTTDIWMQPRRARLIVSAAGIAAMWGIGGLAMWYVVLQHQSPLAPLAFQLAFVAFVSNTLQLMPLLELDGYYMLVDWLEMPLLRVRAFNFVRGELWRKLTRRERLDREERIFALYGTLALGYSGVVLCAAVYFWVHRFQHLLLDAWTHESLAWRLLVGVLLVGFGGPLVFGLGLKVRHLLQTTWRAAARLRYRGETARAAARLEARELVGRLRFHGPLGFAEREAVVTRLRRQRFRPGAYVVRQGERGDRFYLIRQGEAEVVQVGDDGRTQALAVLRRGDYFGELALLSARPVSASVRALTPLETYVLGHETFAATIAPRLRDYGVTRQWIEDRAELARMPLFRQVAHSELDALLDHLRPEEYPAGAVVVRQGVPHDRFYLIRRGRVRVSVCGRDGEEATLAELGPGRYFGEVALLADPVCPATVRALEPVALWSLDQRSFQELLMRQLHLASTLRPASERRVAMCRRLGGKPTA